MTALELDEDRPRLGPKMLALATERRRKFVLALFDAPPKGKGGMIWAAREAGYGTGKSNNKVLTAIATRLLADESIQQAIEEESKRQLRGLPPLAIKALRDLLANPKHRDHARAIDMVLSRTDPMPNSLNVKVEHGFEPVTAAATAEVYARIEELAHKFGIAPARPEPKLIEAVAVSDEATP